MGRRLARVLATGFGAGYSPVAPGTAGSLLGLGLVLAWPVRSVASVCAGGAVLVLLAVAVSTIAEQDLKRLDPSCVVIDEVAGMWLSLAALPQALHTPWLVVAGFLLFRLFDIVKPPPCQQLSRLPGGWGIVLDDVGAAGYTYLALRGLLWISRLG